MAAISAMSTAGMSDTLKKLIEQYNSTPTYNAKSAEEIRAQAEGEIGHYYDQLRLSATQAQNRNDLALQQQQANLARSYEKQREASAKQYADAYSQTDRAMLSRGMQRSSYGAQTLANLRQAGIDAQQAIYDQQAGAEADVGAQRAQLAMQLADQLSQYDASEAADVLNRIRELEDADYAKGLDSAQQQNSLATQIYQMLYQEQRDAVGDAQWQAEFDAATKKSSSSGGSGGSGGSSGSATGATGTGAYTGGVMPYNDFMSALGGSLDSLMSIENPKYLPPANSNRKPGKAGSAEVKTK